MQVKHVKQITPALGEAGLWAWRRALCIPSSNLLFILNKTCKSTEHFLKTIANLPCGHGQAISPFPFWKMMEMILHRKGVKYETMDAKLLGCSQQVTAVPVFPEWHEVVQPLQTILSLFPILWVPNCQPQLLMPQLRHFLSWSPVPFYHHSPYFMCLLLYKLL